MQIKESLKELFEKTKQNLPTNTNFSIAYKIKQESQTKFFIYNQNGYFELEYIFLHDIVKLESLSISDMADALNLSKLNDNQSPAPLESILHSLVDANFSLFVEDIDLSKNSLKVEKKDDIFFTSKNFYKLSKDIKFKNYEAIKIENYMIIYNDDISKLCIT